MFSHSLLRLPDLLTRSYHHLPATPVVTSSLCFCRFYLDSFSRKSHLVSVARRSCTDSQGFRFPGPCSCTHPSRLPSSDVPTNQKFRNSYASSHRHKRDVTLQLAADATSQEALDPMMLLTPGFSSHTWMQRTSSWLLLCERWSVVGGIQIARFVQQIIAC